MNQDYSWIPADAVFLEGGIPGSRICAPKPMTYVVSGASLHRLRACCLPRLTDPGRHHGRMVPIWVQFTLREYVFPDVPGPVEMTVSVIALPQ
jgi:hypothetical protein